MEHNKTCDQLQFWRIKVKRFFKIRDALFDRDKRIQLELEKITELSSTLKRPEITMVCDLSCTPQSYGDFVGFLTLYCILSSKFQVTFCLIVDKLRNDWNNLNAHDRQNRIREFELMGRKVVANSAGKFFLVPSWLEFSESSKTDDLVFADRCFRRKPIYREIQTLNDFLFVKLGCTKQTLLNKSHFSDHESIPKSEYIVWHVRHKSLVNVESDLSEAQIVHYYRLIRDVVGPEIQIVVCSSSFGLIALGKIGRSHNLNFQSARCYSNNFLGDFSLVLRSKFYIQLGGGGLAQYVWSTSVPYFLVFPELAHDTIFSKSVNVDPVNGRINSWQGMDQVFRVMKFTSDSEIKFEMQKFWQKICA